MSSSEQNITVVQQLYAAFNRREMPAIIALLTDDVEWGEPANPYNPAGGTRRGHQGFLEWANIGRAAEDILALDIHKMLADHETVAVIGHMKCLAKPTGETYAERVDAPATRLARMGLGTCNLHFKTQGEWIVQHRPESHDTAEASGH